jgi:hypothetical protein
MGDFSRNPDDRLAAAVARHYVGVRLQQGVPLLDADWNELEDLRRYEAETLGAWFLGDGVPVGSDGFRVMPIVGHGVGTVALASSMATVGLSMIAVDVAASTAAAALGFDVANAAAERFGTSPARVMGARSEPFALADGATLVVQTETLTETATFAAADFADITAATAAEVVAALNAALGGASASVGAGNDFVIRGAEGTDADAGRLLVGGRVVVNERSLRYSAQPLYANDALAALWGVDPLPALATPAADGRFAVYLDAWHREVGSAEDPGLVDPAVGLETAVRLRREWAVRVTPAADFLDALANRPPGHRYYLLAHLDREAGEAAVMGRMIVDERATEMSLRPVVAYRGSDGVLLVDSAGFMGMLVRLRDAVRAFITFLSARFVDPATPYVAGEVAGIDALSAVAGVADHGIALLHAQALGTRGALDFFGQLLEAQVRFVAVWREAVLPLVKPGGTVYQQSYGEMVDAIESFLTGPAPMGFTAIADALASHNLDQAVRSQERISNELGEEGDLPFGVLFVAYLGSPAATIQPNTNFDMNYEITGSVTPEDAVRVEVFIGAGWTATVLNEDGSLPLDVAMGPGDDIERFRVRVRPPNNAAASTQISLRVTSERNPAGLSRTTPQLLLTVGQPPPGSEADFAFSIQNANVPLVGGTYEVPVSTVATLTYRLTNNTNAALDVTFELDPENDPDWGILPTFGQTDTVPAQGSRDYVMQFQAPGTEGVTLTSTLIARNDANGEVAAQSTVTLRSVV